MRLRGPAGMGWGDASATNLVASAVVSPIYVVVTTPVPLIDPGCQRISFRYAEEKVLVVVHVLEGVGGGVRVEIRGRK